MGTESAIALLVEAVADPCAGLPDDVFYFISRMTPLVNVDLLIKDESGRTLLSWRDDAFAGKGWHVPGGIVRFKEALETRVEKVAQMEIGTSVRYDPTPVAIHQFIHRERDLRGHFISILYKCSLPGTFRPRNEKRTEADRGYLMWHDRCPENIIDIHEIYRKYIDETAW